MALLKSLFKEERAAIRTFEDFQIECVYNFFGSHYEARSEKRNMLISYKNDTFIDGLSMVFDMIHVIRDLNMDYVSHTRASYLAVLAENRMLRLEHSDRALKYETERNMEIVLGHSEPLRSE